MIEFFKQKYKEWQKNREAKAAIRQEEFLKNFPLCEWKVYRANPYNEPVATSVTVMARTYADAMHESGKIPLSEWVADPVDWYQDWVGYFAKKL